MSKKKSDEDTIGDRFRLARERGIEVPVFLMFDTGPQAGAVYSQLAGRSLVHTGNGEQEPEALTHTVAEAAGVAHLADMLPCMTPPAIMMMAAKGPEIFRHMMTSSLFQQAARQTT